MNLAIIGSGMIVSDFFTIVEDLPEIHIKAIVGTEPTKDVLLAFQEKYGIEKIYVDFSESLKDADIDTVYLAVPNFLHFSMAKQAILHGKNVICEKPFTLSAKETRELRQLSIEKNVILLEAITNQYLPNYTAIKEQLGRIGNIRIAQLNFSQYSSRYKAFCEGNVLPAFDPKKGGGALMDINIYNIHFVVGLFGKPERVKYFANLRNQIDTSGVLVLEYPEMQVVSVGAKDASSRSFVSIQGDAGTISLSGTTNTLENGFETHLQSGEGETVNLKNHPHRMYDEFKQFAKVIEAHDMAFAKEKLDHSVLVMDVVEAALADAGLHLGE